ncbi:hypothetical protein [Metabacillus hrfriensis]|uniref:Uncharacterized protein n=1 Tax=Metabacillus hrfriensis TaxID=3048891 RepID=A0ACD4RG82_9BACI|nr:hypothetical protein [Metabacillus sp. CT-WN-B3]WHZ59463.1 hypothetical protein QLQ22_09100 [Metabacillus sp. CT-WN-B3]
MSSDTELSASKPNMQHIIEQAITKWMQDFQEKNNRPNEVFRVILSMGLVILGDLDGLPPDL